jgi:hypothetical protein
MKLYLLRCCALVCAVPLLSAFLLTGCDTAAPSKDEAPGEVGKATAPGLKRLEDAKAKAAANKKS